MPISNPDVAELQRVLTTYASVTGFTAANPGITDGVVSQSTAMAVVAMIPRIPKLPSAIVAMSPVILLLMATSDGRDQVFKLIKDNASTISKAIMAMSVYQAATSKPASTPTASVPAAGGVATAPVATVTTPAATTITPPIIWFYDQKMQLFRVANPASIGYLEISPAATRPTTGVEVSRAAFYQATHQKDTPWILSPVGLAATGGGVLAFGLLLVIALRK